MRDALGGVMISIARLRLPIDTGGQRNIYGGLVLMGKRRCKRLTE